jgi:hypothetical protein
VTKFSKISENIRYLYTDDVNLSEIMSIDDIFQFLDIVGIGNTCISNLLDTFKLQHLVELATLEICDRLTIENVIVALKKGAKIPGISRPKS